MASPRARPSAITPCAPRLIESGKKDLKKEVCWILSNITAGSAMQIDGVCASGLVPPLIRLVDEEEFDIRKEAVYALCNACVGGSPAHLSGLVYHGVLPALLSLLEAPDAELLLAVCEALKACLAAGAQSAAADGVNRCCGLIEECGGLDKIEALQLHENTKVYAKAVELLDEYFGDGDGEDAAIAPVATAEGFTFAAP